MVNLISLGPINYTIIYPILLGFLSFLLGILWKVGSHLNDNKIKKGIEPYGTHHFLYLWILFFAESLSIICYVFNNRVFHSQKKFLRII